MTPIKVSSGDEIPILGAIPVSIPIESFWGTNYYKHPPLTEKMVREAEASLGVSLPSELISLLRQQNGGYTKGLAFPTKQPTSWAEDHVPFDHLAGILTEAGSSSPFNLLQTAYMTKEWGLPPRQVLLSGDGHTWITLDYRQGASPSVAWIDVECGVELQLAPSFAAFLDGLVSDEVFREE